MCMMTKLIAGNWKMNHQTKDVETFAAEWKKLTDQKALSGKANLLICPPFPLLSPAKYAFDSLNIAVGAQDCSAQKSGAYTGDVAASLIKDVGASYVIVGHSERRQYHAESSHLIALKAYQALESGLVPIICVGENLEQREQGQAFDVIFQQLSESLTEKGPGDKCVIAYEPIWAIGTGRTASIDDIESMHGFILDKIQNRFPVLYGGSVKADNAKEILSLESVGGVLVGGASLEAASFYQIASF